MRRKRKDRTERRFLFERLEKRDLLAADPFGTNSLQPLDVSRDGRVSALDALRIINVLNRDQTAEVLAAAVDPAQHIGLFVDVTGDGRGTTLDALRVINALQRRQPLIAATLPVDSAPPSRDDLRYDLRTNDYALDLNVSAGEWSGLPVRMRIGDQAASFTDITDLFEGDAASLTPEQIDAVFGEPLPDGDHHVEVQIGEDGSQIEFVITVDRSAPELKLESKDGVLHQQTSELELRLDEPGVTESMRADDLLLATTDDDASEAKFPVAIATLDQGQRIKLWFADILRNADYRLTFSHPISDAAGNASSTDAILFAMEQSVFLNMDPASQYITVDVESPTVSMRWDTAVQQAVATARSGPTIGARVYAMVHTAIYDAWSAYDPAAVSTRLGDTLQRPQTENTDANKTEAMSHAAYQVLIDLFPDQQAIFDQVMMELGLDANDDSDEPSTAAGVGRAMADALLDYRHHDGANQLGDSSAGLDGVPYSNTTMYAGLNRVGETLAIDQWTPEFVPIDAPENSADRVQQFLTPQWSEVVPFALDSPDQYRPEPPQPFLLVDGSVDLQNQTITLADGTVREIDRSLVGSVINPDFIEQAEQVVEASAQLTHQQKLIAEFWEDGGSTSFPPGTWMSFGQFISARDDHSLDDDAKLFFALSNALFDAGIATWESKVHYDYARPVRVIRELGRLGLIGQYDTSRDGYVINARTPEGETQSILATDFLTYQTPGGDPSPPFAEYTSGHSSFSAAGATILQRFTGQQTFGGEVTFQPGQSRFQPDVVPAETASLRWETFREAADEAGVSRMYGGIHFRGGDLRGRELGNAVANAVWDQVQRFIQGTGTLERTTESQV